MVDVVDFSQEHVSSPISGDVSSKDALRRAAVESKLQTKYGSLMSMFSKVTSEFVASRSLPRRRMDDIFKLRSSVDALRDEASFLGVRFWISKKKTRQSCSSETHAMRKLITFKRCGIPIVTRVITLQIILMMKRYAWRRIVLRLQIKPKMKYVFLCAVSFTQERTMCRTYRTCAGFC